jgi:2-polyprenyl-3-methyl-5-hydroxy-6-metoxy-1,4-benzoquinol methylase
VSCNLCGTDDSEVLFPAGVAQVNQIVRCKQCGLMYASPRRDADHVDIASWGDDPDWDISVKNPQRVDKEQLQTRDYARTRAMLNDLYPRRGKVLEVGSSLGLLLKTFRDDGWQVLGVEPDRNLVRYATNKMGIETINSLLEDASIPDNSIDVVVLLHVIEHVPDPVGTLREIYRVLKPGGHLVMETPRYDTLMFKLMGRHERSLSCDGHIFFFTTDSLRRTYERAGFVLHKLDYVGRSLTVDRLAYNIGVVSKSQSVGRFVKSLAGRLGLDQLKLTINLRDMQRLCLRKPAEAQSSAQVQAGNRVAAVASKVA